MKDDSNGYIKNCLLINRKGGGALFTTDGTPYLDRFAIIPMELFEAMGGTEDPAYKAFVKPDPELLEAMSDYITQAGAPAGKPNSP